MTRASGSEDIQSKLHISPPLTFSHRSGVTPYTSSCELAGSCVFGKQSPERLSLRPRVQYIAISLTGQALSLTYGRFFAEFLSGRSLVPLGLLALSTCVGLRYGLDTLYEPTSQTSFLLRSFIHHCVFVAPSRSSASYIFVVASRLAVCITDLGNEKYL